MPGPVTLGEIATRLGARVVGGADVLIEQAGSLDPEKVTAALNATDITTFFGHVKFATDVGHHGLQVAHEMVLAQWQMENGKLARQVVWPTAAQSAPLQYPIGAGH